MKPTVETRRTLEAACDRLFAAGPFPLAVSLIDVDDFKRFNSSTTNDERESWLARLQEELAARCGLAFVSRVGGDEFLIVMRGDAMPAVQAAVAAIGKFTVSVGTILLEAPAQRNRVWRACAVVCSESKAAGGNTATARQLADVAEDAAVIPAALRPPVTLTLRTGRRCGHAEHNDACPGCRNWNDPAYRAAQEARSNVVSAPKRPWRFWIEAPTKAWEATVQGNLKAAAGILSEAITGHPMGALNPRELTCIHLGEPLDKPEAGTPYRPDGGGTSCNCPGKWRRACAVHGECRVTDSRGPQKCCQVGDPAHPLYCGDYRNDAPT
jgi:GGDEF domain-containing protein